MRDATKPFPRLWIWVAGLSIGLAVGYGCHPLNDCEDDGRCDCGGGERCELVCHTSPCDIACDALEACDAVCDHGCRLDCDDLTDCDLDCLDDCDIECTSLSDCTASCGARCDYACRDASRCDVRVGPESRIDCRSVSDCRVECHGACEVTCENVGHCDVTCLDLEGRDPQPPMERGRVWSCPPRDGG